MICVLWCCMQPGFFILFSVWSVEKPSRSWLSAAVFKYHPFYQEKMTGMLDARGRWNAFGLTSGTKGAAPCFVLLPFIFFPAVEYWASPGCDSGINAEFGSGKSVFSLWHLDSKGKLLRAVRQEFLHPSDCMLVAQNQGDSQRPLEGLVWLRVPFGLLSLPTLSVFLPQTYPYDTCTMSFSCSK